jgi:hypothetical protein
MFGSHLLIEELISGSRHIVTNLPLDLEALNAAFLERFDNGCISDRVTMVEDNELKQIFTLKDRYPSEGRLFVLDEAHIAFNARQWQSTGEDVLFYLSQHRKLGDDVIVITQAAGNLDKQFRSVAQTFVRCRNHATKRAGMFRGRERFTANYFETEMMKGEPAQVTSYEIDWRADCYDTAKGVGISGSNADKGAKRNGISIWWGVAAAVVGVALIGAIPTIIAPLLSSLLVDEVEITAPPPVQAVEIIPVNDTYDVNGIRVTSILVYSKGAVINLSDGRTLTHRDVTEISDHYVVFNGKRLWITNPPKNELEFDQEQPYQEQLSANDVEEKLGRVSTNLTASDKRWSDSEYVQKIAHLAVAD